MIARNMPKTMASTPAQSRRLAWRSEPGAGATAGAAGCGLVAVSGRRATGARAAPPARRNAGAQLIARRPRLG